MGLLFDSTCTELATIFVTLVTILLTYFKWKYGYWKRRGLPYIEPKIPLGTMGNFLLERESIVEMVYNHYDYFKSRKLKHGGCYLISTPVYIVIDPQCIKNILTKDFQYFVDRVTFFNEKRDPLSVHLFNVDSSKWRDQRVKLTPAFTSAKMKIMFQTLLECGEEMDSKMDGYNARKEVIDIKDVLTGFTTNVIGSVVFGLECNSFKDPDAPFKKYGKKMFERSKPNCLLLALALALPEFSRAVGIKLIPTNSSNFFLKVVRDTINYRKNNNFVRKDFMQILIDLKHNANTEDNEYKHDGKSLSCEEIAAQCYVFFIAGFETSSGAMTFVLYELAEHQDIQQKVRDEINTVLAKHDGKITYEAIAEMKYMGQVLDETLRKYPPGGLLTRRCIKDYKVPDTDLIIEKGTIVFIPVNGLHYDPEYFKDPQKFDPERFSEENKHKIHPFTYLPFGEGPRICIALRFGVMQSKVALTLLLRRYKFTLNSRTETPLKMDATSFTQSAHNGIWLDSEKI